jgi:hypothetical protein
LTLQPALLSGKPVCTENFVRVDDVTKSPKLAGSLEKDAPSARPVQRSGSITLFPILGGLHHRYAGFRFSVHTATIKAVIAGSAKQFGLPPEAMSGTRRQKPFEQARHCAIYVIRNITSLCLPQIGRYFGEGLDHTICCMPVGE